VQTEYKDGKLTWNHLHTGPGSVYFAYFPPYSYQQHLSLVAKCQRSDLARVISLGQTLQGRELECIAVGRGDRVCWIIHRQHPGESMADYYADGLLTRLLGLNTNGKVDGNVRRLLQMYKFYIVPCMCLDGAVLGDLRTNSAGANLNREWADSGHYRAPTLGRSPEVYHVLNKMKETGVDCFLDIHGDEELPFNFLAGTEKTINWGPRLQTLHCAFLGAYVRANGDMQKDVGYEAPSDASGAAGNIANNAATNCFNCLSVMLEMPFKDCLTNPDPNRGWSPNRAWMLGASVVDPLLYIHPFLGDQGDFWTHLPADDAYVAPTANYEDKPTIKNS
jgi:murein tripeptide amidase MpaA